MAENNKMTTQKSSDDLVSQVKNDLNTLEDMLKDQMKQETMYKPNVRWKTYTDMFVEYLRETGLEDFRRRTNTGRDDPARVLSAFGAVDLLPVNDKDEWARWYDQAACFPGGERSRELQELAASNVGNPEGFSVNSHFVTESWLNYFIRYKYVSRFMDLDNAVIVEVGSGLGAQAEMLKKAHPGITILLFDLPTQLYVANQYLTEVFKSEKCVISCNENESIDNFDDIEKGNIYLFPNWKIELLKGKKFDLLWNSASFQEMEYDTASRYLSCAQGAENIFLLYRLTPTHKETGTRGRGVVNSQVIDEHTEIDCRSYKPVFLEKRALKNWSYKLSFWKKGDHAKNPLQNHFVHEFLRKLRIRLPG